MPSEPEPVTGSALDPARDAGREDAEDLPDALDVLNSVSSAAPRRSPPPEVEEAPQPKVDKGKGKAVEYPPPPKANGKDKATEPPPPPPPPPPKPKKRLPNVRVHLPIRSVVDDSDSDLEIIDPQKQAQDEAKRLLNEKRELIASMRRPRPIPKPAAGSPNAKTKLTSKQMQLQLLQKGRLQAIREREERIQELKAKGVLVQTAEEREREQQEVENLLEKAREEALEIKRREKKEERLARGEKISDHEGDDSDFELMEEDDEESEIAYSEDEEDEEGEGEADDGGLVDGAADGPGPDGEGNVEMEDAVAVDPVSPAFSLSSILRERNSASPTPRLSDMPPAFISDEDSADDDGGFAPFKRKLPRKKQRVTDEDDDDGDAASTGTAVPPEGPKIPDIFKNAGHAPAMGMSQLFAGTLGGGSAGFGTLGGDAGRRVDAMRKLPDEILQNSQAPPPDSADQAEADVVPNTQVDRLSLDCPQSHDDHGHDSWPVLTLDYSQSQVMDSPPAQQFPDPTQDMGFEVKSSPAPPRFEASPEPPEGSVPTQVLDEHLGFKKLPRGRLVRRAADFSDEEKGSDDDGDDTDLQDDAFAVLKKAARKPKAPAKKPFDKSKSEAKAMVDERAVESEDEFGGIGGGGSENDADDDADDDALGDEEMKDLLDDGEQEVDEGALAAFYAQREKLQDEKEVNRLFRSIQNGMLRKKRGAGFDLDDDSDDEYMAQERRRRAKRRQIAQIRKALLQDEVLGKIAEDPKKAAFFRSLADNASDDDGDDFLDKTEEDLFAHLRDESQSQLPIPDGEIAASPGDGSADGPPPQLPQQVHSDPRRPVRKTKPSLNIREVCLLNGIPNSHTDDVCIRLCPSSACKRIRWWGCPSLGRKTIRDGSSSGASQRQQSSTAPSRAHPRPFHCPPSLPSKQHRQRRPTAAWRQQASGCRRCYAERRAARFRPRVRTLPPVLLPPPPPPPPLAPVPRLGRRPRQSGAWAMARASRWAGQRAAASISGREQRLCRAVRLRRRTGS